MKDTVSIGGTPPPPNPDEIIVSETFLHLTEAEAKKYDRIVGRGNKLIRVPDELLPEPFSES